MMKVFALMAIMELIEFENPLNSHGVVPVYKTRKEAEEAGDLLGEMLELGRPTILELDIEQIELMVGKVSKERNGVSYEPSDN